MFADGLLSQLYGIHAMTGYEWPMIAFVREYVEKNIPDAEVRMDRLGNLYITKGEVGVGYPTLVCHMDQVQTLHSDDFQVHQEGDMLMAGAKRTSSVRVWGLMIRMVFMSVCVVWRSVLD